jgi:2,4-dienoyl-CoA reductase-like NADH-dependent reductase (Old Yellow Enzyme family)
MTSNDPLLQPYQLKHLTLKNRVMSTSHEPAYSEDGMPKERYRLYHAEKAKGGIALTMTAGRRSSRATARPPSALCFRMIDCRGSLNLPMPRHERTSAR